jgi:hypothetical protein
MVGAMIIFAVDIGNLAGFAMMVPAGVLLVVKAPSLSSSVLPQAKRIPVFSPIFSLMASTGFVRLIGIGCFLIGGLGLAFTVSN